MHFTHIPETAYKFPAKFQCNQTTINLALNVKWEFISDIWPTCCYARVMIVLPNFITISQTSVELIARVSHEFSVRITLIRLSIHNMQFQKSAENLYFSAILFNYKWFTLTLKYELVTSYQGSVQKVFWCPGSSVRALSLIHQGPYAPVPSCKNNTLGTVWLLCNSQ